MTLLSRPSKSKTSLSVDGAKHLVVPVGMVSSCEPSLNALASVAGDEFDVWQRQINRLALAKTAGGLWAARTVVLSIPRQTGKTFNVGWLAVHRCAVEPGLRAIWTAHHFSVIKDTFEGLQGLVGRPEMESLVDPARGFSMGAGKEEIRFRNGSRLFFRARERGAIRGIKNVGLLVVDEAQVLSDSALASMLPTQNRAHNPQTFYMGTPPGPRDMSEVFYRLRSHALAGKSKKSLYVEFGADAGCDPLDRVQWAKANPSFPRHTTEEVILELHDNLAADDFRREALGVWDEHVRARVVDPVLWERATVDEKPDGGVVSFAVDMSPDRQVMSVGACSRLPDGVCHVELVEHVNTRQRGTAWVVDWLADRWPRTAAVVVDAQSPAMSLLPDLQKAHVRVTVTNSQDMARACGRFLDMLASDQLTHLVEDRQQALWDAVAGATTRPIGQGGAFGWNRAGGDVDISPLVAVTLALHGAVTSKRNPNRKQRILV